MIQKDMDTLILGLIPLVIVVPMLILRAHRPALWTRLTEAEANLHRRLGLPDQQAEALRRFEHSKAYGGFLWAIVAVSGFVTIGSIVLLLLFPD